MKWNGGRLEFSLMALALAGCAPSSEVQEVPGTILSQRVRITERGTFTYVKFFDESGVLRGAVVDAQGQLVPESAVASAGSGRIGDFLAAALKAAGTAGRGLLRVDVALQDDPEPVDEPIEFGSGEVGPFTSSFVRLNGRDVSRQEFHALNEQRLARLDAARKAKRSKRHQALVELTRRQDLKLSQKELEVLADASGSIVLELEAGQIEKFLEKNQDLVAAIDLHQEGTDDSLATAMAATSVNPGALQLPNSQGAGIGIYMTESGCPDPGVITNYTRLAGSNTDHSRNVSAILRAVSPSSYVYCRGGMALPTLTDLAGYAGNPRIYIVSRSNGSTVSNDYGILDRDWDNFVYDNAVLIHNAAGNEGESTGTINSPGKGLNILTVGNYDDATNTIRGSSSYVDPSTKNMKPELSGPGVDIDAGGFTMTGTSQSTPHVAAMAADFMSAYPWLQLRPYLAKALLMGGAEDSINGGLDKVGLGGADYLGGYYQGAYAWYHGANGDFDAFDAQDGAPNNGYVDAVFHVSSTGYKNVRVVINWLNRGTYTYDHRADAHPIGMDLDFAVYAPDGSRVGHSLSWDNPFEVLDFKPTLVGNYTVQITRTFNRDTSSKLNMGLYIDMEW